MEAALRKGLERWVAWHGCGGGHGICKLCCRLGRCAGRHPSAEVKAGVALHVGKAYGEVPAPQAASGTTLS